jgi:hypothetical protein
MEIGDSKMKKKKSGNDDQEGRFVFKVLKNYTAFFLPYFLGRFLCVFGLEICIPLLCKTLGNL